MAKDIKVNKGCDQDCAIGCYSSENSDPFGFNATCMSSCGCWFKLLDHTNDELVKMDEDLNKAQDKVVDFFKERGEEFAQEVGPAVEAYQEAEKEVQQDFVELLKKHAVNDLGCDPQCVNDCTN